MECTARVMNRIVEEMEERRVTVAALCKQAGVNPVTFWRYRTGRTAPSLDRVAAMGSVLGLPIETLVSGPSGPSGPYDGGAGKVGGR